MGQRQPDGAQLRNFPGASIKHAARDVQVRNRVSVKKQLMVRGKPRQREQ
jgi:hypothetical protein